MCPSAAAYPSSSPNPVFDVRRKLTDLQVSILAAASLGQHERSDHAHHPPGHPPPRAISPGARALDLLPHDPSLQLLLSSHDHHKQTAMICSFQQENSLQQFSSEDQITKSKLINKKSL
jgi:hypothetical protein